MEITKGNKGKQKRTTENKATTLGNKWKQETIDTAIAPEPGDSLVNFREFTSEPAEIH